MYQLHREHSSSLSAVLTLTVIRVFDNVIVYTWMETRIAYTNPTP
ncbi:hypothetical protein APHWI1_1529 [Anaplasma phagocytophilum str. ApWI1]|uniref:Uncharacterized protein n=1 Tax=Anaplasma phagocytophilum str. ApWI1 TaxID=1359155 RepID=A0A0F3PXQ4_ANAPH|nr:hypothetical protein APHHGE2_0749 [Anaplasma phagocytophilum str. HGE2]KJV85043.1 hypothetical protein APHWI1_1529 [Anaplasma phagocytophilum str. ApWI1]KJZ98227.1 hypothetical protein APHDU1_1272 [Anaplasma phagocytophilum]KKA00881.1 hypothetical protein APHCR_1500 [Anaplasma phagocytophilum str. CR1007]